jgi:predicted permease
MIEILVKMAFLIFIGFILRSRNIITEEGQRTLSDILLIVVLPCSILSSSSYDFDESILKSLAIVALASGGFYSVGLFFMRFVSKRLPITEDRQRVFTTMTIFANTGFIGFPVMTALFGREGLLMAVIYNMMYNVFMYTAGMRILSGQKKIDLKRILLNPINIASVAAILIFVSPFRLPSLIGLSISAVGEMSVPLSMIIMGTSLVRVSLRDLLKDGYSLLTSFIRLVFFPLLMLGAMLIVRPEPVTAAVCVLMTALPCGTMNVIFAEKYDCAPDFASRAVIQSTVFMTVTLFLMSMLTSNLFPILG